MLPDELRRALPAELQAEAVGETISLRTGLRGGYGETHLLEVLPEVGGRWLALSRGSVLDPLEAVVLDARHPFSVERGSWDAHVTVRTAAGETFRLAPSMLDRDAVDRLEAIAPPSAPAPAGAEERRPWRRLRAGTGGGAAEEREEPRPWVRLRTNRAEARAEGGTEERRPWRRLRASRASVPARTPSSVPAAPVPAAPPVPARARTPSSVPAAPPAPPSVPAPSRPPPLPVREAVGDPLSILPEDRDTPTPARARARRRSAEGAAADPPTLVDALEARIVALLGAGEVEQARQLYQETMGASVLVSHNAVEHIARLHGIEPPAARPRSAAWVVTLIALAVGLFALVKVCESL